MSRIVLVLGLATLVVAAGCVKPSVTPANAPNVGSPTELLAFAQNVTVDKARIASEPSIKVAKDGTIFVSAPTGNIKYATRPQDATVEADKGMFQSALWKSKDGGKTFTFVDTMGAPYHSTMPGGGDSDLAIDGKGTIYMTDQLGLATEVMSVSTDGGNTWTGTNPMASGQPVVDRQWLWPDPETPGTVYMVFDHVGSEMTVSKSTDFGNTWTATKAADFSTSPGPIVAIKGLVAFSAFNGDQIAFVASTDKGATWKTTEVGKGHGKVTDFFPQTVADKAGNVYVAWMEEKGLAYTVSTDLGKTWSPNRLAVPLTGTHTFMWAVAGEKGRLGFAWYDAPDPAKGWFERAAVMLGADTPMTTVMNVLVTQEPTRVGPPCTSGSTCTSGREYGDFQQVAVGPDGYMVVSFVHVVSAMDGGRVVFAKQTSGPKLLDAPFDPWVV